MAVAVTRGRHRVHGEHQITGRHQRSDEQAPIGLDADHHLARLIDMPADEVMEAGDPLHPLGQAATTQPLTVLVPHMHVMVGSA
jgi:hypothetical protein